MSNPSVIFKTALLQIHSKLTEDEVDFIIQNSQYIKAPKQSVLIEEHKVQKHIFFLVSGLVRSFYINQKGEEITVRFIDTSGWVTHYSALLTQARSKYIFQTIEDSEVLALPHTIIQEGYDRFKGIERLGRLIAESVLRTQQQRIEEFQFNTPEERYLSFIQQYPDVFNRVSISHLSTYLGIQRQSLTRIRKRLMSK